jgi:recombination associated protein RdgC
MLFKNLTAYRFTKPWRIALSDLEAGAAQRPSRDCQMQELEHVGFDHIHEKTRLRVWPIQNEQVFLVKVTHTKRLLPSSVVKDEARKVIAEREKTTGEKVKGAEKKEIIANVRDSLLEKAFQKKSNIQAIIHLGEQEIWIDQVAEKKCMMVLNLLRKVAGSLPVEPISSSGEIVQQLSSWLLNEKNCPEGIEIGDAAKLVDTEDARAQVNIKRQDLHSEEIRALLDARCVISLVIEIGGQLSAELTNNRVLKSIKPKEDFDLGTADGEDVNDAFDTLVHMSVEEIVLARRRLKGSLPESQTSNEEAPA